MANEVKKTVGNKSNGSSLAPILIIGAIFVATILGIYWVSQSGDKEPAEVAGGKTPTPEQRLDTGNAPPGAQPANFKGSATSPVTVEEFADFQCPTCAVVHPKMNEVISRYSGRVKFVYRHFPIVSVHQNAFGASVAAEAAGMQGKFWEMQNQLFQNQNQWSREQNPKEKFIEYAQKIGLDMNKFNNDLAAMNTQSRVQADLDRAQALRIRSTPTILINGNPVPFQQVEVDSLGKLIDAELAKFNQSGNSPTQAAGNSAEESNSAENSANSNQ